MRSYSLLLLAALVVATPLKPKTQFDNFGIRNAGADADDSWPIGEIAETATFVVDRIEEARKFLADLDDDSFDFQQWYDQELDDFKADQDNVPYDNDQDRADDLQDFTQQLNEISMEFASSQGEDYANFVRDIIGESIDHLHEQSEELLERMQETANDINDLEEQEYDLYIKMSKISCLHKTNFNVLNIDMTKTDTGNANNWPGKLTDNPPGDVYPDLVGPTHADDPINPGNIAAKSSCYLDQIREELKEAYRKYNTVSGVGGNNPTNGQKQKQRKQIKKYQKKYRDYVRKWQKYQHTFKDVQDKEDHEEDEYEQYELLLYGANTLQAFAMDGSDKLVLDDSRVPGVLPDDS